jgi:hypothetical protein
MNSELLSKLTVFKKKIQQDHKEAFDTIYRDWGEKAEALLGIYLIFLYHTEGREDPKVKEFNKFIMDNFGDKGGEI